MKKLLHLLFFLSVSSVFALQADDSGRQVFARFEQNKGQLPATVVASAAIPGGKCFAEHTGFTFHFQETGHAGHSHGEEPGHNPEKLNGHVVKLRFSEASATSTPVFNQNLNVYNNYYSALNGPNGITKAYEYESLSLNELYPGIRLELGSNAKGLKYDFVLKPGADPNQIVMFWEGASRVNLRKGQLEIKTTLGNIIEEAPSAWQIIDGNRVSVDCAFKLDDTRVSFELGKYNASYELIIDPQLVFGSFSGSSADNWGFTATYDYAGNTYTAGIVFGIGYPTTTGAYSESFSGGAGSRPCDIGIMKFDAAGQRMYSTYLGGSSNEIPQSLIVSNANELFVFGTTGSSDFPTTATAWETQFSGGEQVSILRSGISFPSGTDMFVSRFSESGDRLLASTLLGGSGNDGLNTAPQLRYNYADEARGGIMLDNQNNVFIGCSTSSSDFPVPGNAFQATFGGGTQDGMVVKLNENLSTLYWGTYIGGAGNDGVMNIALDGSGKVFVAGGTSSIDFPVTEQVYQNQNGGAQSDGFVSCISPNGQNLVASTYYGSNAYDQIYLVATSRDNSVYVFGQTESGGNFYRQDFSFSENNGKQFISKFSNDLRDRTWSTTFGNGLAKPDITPSAFTVDICGQIFVCGWGGASNAGPDGGSFGGTSGLTTTADAYQQTTDNNDFYLMVLDEQDQNLVYATFFGGSTSSEHVDGGTSRFDRRGVVHQAVCAGCGGRDDFPTTPGVWSNVNGSTSGCNNAVYKFDFQLPATVASFTGEPIACVPYQADFQNTSSNGETYSWFINGNPIAGTENLSNTFNTPGLYLIQLVAENLNSCNVRDTFMRQIRIVNSTHDTFDSLSICYLSEIQVGVNFPIDPYYEIQWVPSSGLDNPDAPNPNASPEAPTNYVLYLSLASCADTIEQFVDVRTDVVDAGPDLDICRGMTVQIGIPDTSGGYSYRWMPAAFLNNDSIATPLASVDETTVFELLRIPPAGANTCPGKDSLTVYIPEGSPLAAFDTEVLASCTDVKVLIHNFSEAADQFRWEFGTGTGSDQELEPFVTYPYGDSIHVTLYVENSVCRDTLEFTEALEPLAAYFSINNSNAFSPNGDGTNDCFSPALQDLPAPDDKNFLSCSTLHIFDRWGRQVFEAVEQENGCWDGNDPSGEACPDGTYFFIFKGQGQEIQGQVELLR